MISDSTTRSHFIVALTNKKGSSIDNESILHRLSSTYMCVSILRLRKETKSAVTILVGVKCQDASKNTATKTIKGLFREYFGMDCDIRFKKGWGTICLFFVEERGDFFVYGNFSKEDIYSVAEQTKKHKKQSFTPQGERKKRKKNLLKKKKKKSTQKKKNHKTNKKMFEKLCFLKKGKVCFLRPSFLS